MTLFALSSITSQNATQIDPPCDLKYHVCRTCVRYKKKQKLFDKNTQYHGIWQWIKNAVIYSSILVSSIRILLARQIFNSLFECTKCKRLLNKCITCTQHNNYQKYMIVFFPEKNTTVKVMIRSANQF